MASHADLVCNVCTCLQDIEGKWMKILRFGVRRGCPVNKPCRILTSYVHFFLSITLSFQTVCSQNATSIVQFDGIYGRTYWIPHKSKFPFKVKRPSLVIQKQLPFSSLPIIASSFSIPSFPSRSYWQLFLHHIICSFYCCYCWMDDRSAWQRKMQQSYSQRNRMKDCFCANCYLRLWLSTCIMKFSWEV